MPARRVMDVLKELGLLRDDRPDPLTLWVDRKIIALPGGIRSDVVVWVAHMRDGGPRSRPRADQTLINKVGMALPFLTWVTDRRGYTTLRQVTREDCKEWLDSFDGDRPRATIALRGLFRTLKARKLVFSDPTRYIRVGKMLHSVPTPLAPHQLVEVAQRAAAEPALRLVLALASVHALSALEIRTVLLEQIDLPNDRVTLRGVDRPLDAYTRSAVADYLRLRQQTWPRTRNPHLIVTKHTAHEGGAATHNWMSAWLRELGLTITQLRMDRILEEAIATCGDALHLANMFNLSSTTATRYANAVHQGGPS